MVTLSSATPSTPATKRCPRCLLEKHLREFRQTATLAQTRAWLKNPNAKRPHTYTGVVCNACRVKRKPSELTPSEHRKRLINEGKSMEFADMVYAERRVQGKKRLAESAKKSRRKRYGTLIEDHLEHIANLLRTTRDKCNYHYKTTNDPTTKIFYAVTQSLLSQVRRDVLERRSEGRSVPTDWRTMIDDKQLQPLREAYANVRGEMQDRIASVYLAITGDRKTS